MYVKDGNPERVDGCLNLDRVLLMGGCLKNVLMYKSTVPQGLLQDPSSIVSLLSEDTLDEDAMYSISYRCEIAKSSNLVDTLDADSNSNKLSLFSPYSLCPSLWNTKEVLEWFEYIGLGSLTSNIKHLNVDGEQLIEKVSSNTLAGLGIIKLGNKKLVEKTIKCLLSVMNDSVDSDALGAKKSLGKYKYVDINKDKLKSIYSNGTDLIMNQIYDFVVKEYSARSRSDSYGGKTLSKSASLDISETNSDGVSSKAIARHIQNNEKRRSSSPIIRSSNKEPLSTSPLHKSSSLDETVTIIAIYEGRTFKFSLPITTSLFACRKIIQKEVNKIYSNDEKKTMKLTTVYEGSITPLVEQSFFQKILKKNKLSDVLIHVQFQKTD